MGPACGAPAAFCLRCCDKVVALLLAVLLCDQLSSSSSVVAAARRFSSCEQVNGGGLCAFAPFTESDTCKSCAAGKRSKAQLDTEANLDMTLVALNGGVHADAMLHLLPLLNQKPASRRKWRMDEWLAWWWFADACTQWVAGGGPTPEALRHVAAMECATVWEEANTLASKALNCDQEDRNKMEDRFEHLRVMCSYNNWPCAPAASEAGMRLPPLPPRGAAGDTANAAAAEQYQKCNMRVVTSKPTDEEWRASLDVDVV